MSEPIDFSAQLHAWRQRKEARAAALQAAGLVSDTLPQPRVPDHRLEDPPKGEVAWIDRLRAEPWAPTVKD